MLIRFFVIWIILSLWSSISVAQDRAIWATIWSVNSPEKIDEIVKTVQQYHFNKVFIQVRYRGDALYFPNRTDTTYENREERSYILKNGDFDPLSYMIEQLKGTDIQVHAWVPIFVITPYDLSKIGPSNLYYAHPEWITVSDNGVKMRSNEHEGAFLDPGIPEVQQYMINVLSDIASNYDIDGIQLDYIRYPDSIYGYNPLAIANFKLSEEKDFERWKQQQINTFVNKAFIQLKNIKPEMEISAAVFANQKKASNQLSQNWNEWIKDAYIDQVYVMAYNTSNRTFENVLKDMATLDKSKINVILRAWTDNKPYSYHLINDKIELCKKYQNMNMGFYSYSGLIKNQYLKHIKF